MHQLAEIDDNAEADLDDDENIDDEIEYDLIGGTQVLIDAIENPHSIINTSRNNRVAVMKFSI